ncbi:MAG TPA: HD domain-containing protein [Candidatus Glassbacteria bacterium]|nr:HD domain-containing protein [Candidatus Glassbacteria bacterium]
MAEEQTSNGEKDKEGIKELLETSYPLLQRLREMCPGTYKHSQAIAAMIEGISIDLNLDVTFMKVAATYHDIGKLLNPKCFTENQLDDENMHDKLDPKLSYQLISRHVSDTAFILLNEQCFPEDLIRIASQHHGTSVMKYFFDKSGSDVDDYFRYKGAKPTCVEAAVLMICDCLEAKTRAEAQKRQSSFNPTIIIEDIINELLMDGQLDDVYMRLGDLQKIKDSLAKELQGTYQKRVDYSKAKSEAPGVKSEKPEVK